MISSIKRTKKEFVIVDKKDNSKVTITNKVEDKLVIYDEDILSEIVDNKFNKKYKELLYLVTEIEESEDSTESDAELALLKIDDYRTKIIEKYFRYLKATDKEKYLKLLALLDNKLLSLNFIHGRGR